MTTQCRASAPRGGPEAVQPTWPRWQKQAHWHVREEAWRQGRGRLCPVHHMQHESYARVPKPGKCLERTCCTRAVHKLRVHATHTCKQAGRREARTLNPGRRPASAPHAVPSTHTPPPPPTPTPHPRTCSAGGVATSDSRSSMLSLGRPLTKLLSSARSLLLSSLYSRRASCAYFWSLGAGGDRCGRCERQGRGSTGTAGGVTVGTGVMKGDGTGGAGRKPPLQERGTRAAGRRTRGEGHSTHHATHTPTHTSAHTRRRTHLMMATWYGRSRNSR